MMIVAQHSSEMKIKATFAAACTKFSGRTVSRVTLIVHCASMSPTRSPAHVMQPASERILASWPSSEPIPKATKSLTSSSYSFSSHSKSAANEEITTATTSFFATIDYFAHTCFWIILGVTTAYYMDVVNVFISDPRISNISIFITIIIAVVAVVLLVVVMQLPADATSQLDTHPFHIIGLLSLVAITLLSAIYTLWPVYHYGSPFILAALTMGAIFSVNLLPAF